MHRVSVLVLHNYSHVTVQILTVCILDIISIARRLNYHSTQATLQISFINKH